MDKATRMPQKRKLKQYTKSVCIATRPIYKQNTILDLSFLNIHNPFTNKRISVYMYLDKHSRMSLDTKDYIVKQISHYFKDVVISSQRNVNWLANMA